MTATVHQFSDLVQRREIQRLEEAVKANNITRIGRSDVARSDLFFARTPEEQKFRHIPIEKTEMPEPWGIVIFKAVCWVAIVTLCIAGLPLLLPNGI